MYLCCAITKNSMDQTTTSNMQQICPYHNRAHTESPAEAHAGCASHGHCIAGPRSCTWARFSHCPAQLHEKRPVECPRHKCVHQSTDALHSRCAYLKGGSLHCIAGPTDCTRYLDCPAYGAVQMRRHTYVKTNENGYYCD